MAEKIVKCTHVWIERVTNGYVLETLHDCYLVPKEKVFFESLEGLLQTIADKFTANIKIKE